MKRLLACELLKWKRSLAVKVVFGIFMLNSVLCGVVPALGESALMRQGFFAPFLMAANFGGMLFVLAGITGGTIDKEFELGTIHNIMGRGIERSKYFAVKVIYIMAADTLIYISSTCVYTLFRCLAFGVGSDLKNYSGYLLKVLIYSVVSIVMVLAYQCVFIFFSVLFRNAVVTFIASVVTNAAVNSLQSISYRFGKPMGLNAVTLEMRNMAVEDKILSVDFFVMQVPNICMGAVFLILAYQMFKRRDIG